MKKMKKSLKLIILIASLVVVAAATIVTIVLTTGGKRKEKNPEGSSFMLTAEQKLLMAEINDKLENSVTSTKLDNMVYSSDVSAIAGATYSDNNTVWRYDNPAIYTVDVYNGANSLVSLADAFVSNELMLNGSALKVLKAVKNHFYVHVYHVNGDNEILICSAENYKIVIHKNFMVDFDGNNYYIGGTKFLADVADDIFMILTKTGDDFKVELYEYLSDYSNYDKFVYSIDNSLAYLAGFVGNSLYVSSDKVVSYTKTNGFELANESENLTTHYLENGKIIETRTEASQNTKGAELVSGKYYTYSYVLHAAGKVQEVELGNYNKISAVLYSGEKYFGLFLQQLDPNNVLISGGIAVYYDYDLNVVARYEAKSSSSKIHYFEGTQILTQDGVFSASNGVDLTKKSTFDSIEMTLHFVLSSGNIILKNSDNMFVIYDINLRQILDFSFEAIVNFIDDKNVVFQKNSEYYLYNTITNKAEKFNYVDRPFSRKSTLYLVQVGERYSLYDGSTLLQSELVDYDDSIDELLVVEKLDNSKINYYFFDNKEGNSASVVNFEKSEKDEVVYSAGTETTWYYTGHNSKVDGTEYIEPIWYEYDDLVLKSSHGFNSSTDGRDANNSIYILARHCIQEGNYSKVAYHDYFEIQYVGMNAASSTDYAPLRVYYKVRIVNGEPVLEIVEFDHVFLFAGKQAGISSYNNHYLNEQAFLVSGEEYAAGLRVNNTATPTSCDDFVNSGYYSYVGSKLNYDGTGFKLVYDGLDFICQAEVYGESIRVSLVFEFRQSTSAAIRFADCKFGRVKVNDDNVLPATNGKPTDIVTEKDYYNSLYYQTLAVGVKLTDSAASKVMNNSFNFNQEMILTNSTPVSTYYMNSQLSNSFGMGVKFLQKHIMIDNETPTPYTATFSNITYYSDDFTPLYLGELALDIAGGRLVGFTNLQNTAYDAISNDDLYDFSLRKQKDGMVWYYAQGPAEGSWIEYEALAYDNHNSSYYFNIKNASQLYTAGGLNKTRFVYAIYEPLTYGVELDYNLNQADSILGDGGIANEIDYLKAYAGISVGNTGNGDYLSFNNNWPYIVEESTFGDYTEADKYYPKDFEDNETRVGSDYFPVAHKKATMLPSYMVTGTNIYGNTRVIRQYYFYIQGNQYYFYIANDESPTHYNTLPRSADGCLYLMAYKNITDLDGYSNPPVFPMHTKAYSEQYLNGEGYKSGDTSVVVRIDFSNDVTKGEIYYKEKNTYTYQSGLMSTPVLEYKENNMRAHYINVGGVPYYFQINYDTARSHYSTNTGNSYMVAYKNIADLDSVEDDDFGKIHWSNETNYKNIENAYQKGCDKIYLCIDSTDVNIANYFAVNEHTRTGSYVGKYRYDEGVLSENTGVTEYSVTEKFQFYYTDDVILSSTPLHIHFDFMGWKVLQGDLTAHNENTGLIEPSYTGVDNLTDNSINPIADLYLAGSSTTYFNYWTDLETTIDGNGVISWKPVSNKTIKLLAQWKPVQCNVEVTLWTTATNDADTLYYGLSFFEKEELYTDKIETGFLVSKNDVPQFRIGEKYLDEDLDGKLDKTVSFYYSTTKQFSEIFETINQTEYYPLISINSTGLRCRLAGWAYADNGQYYSIIEGVTVDGEGNDMAHQSIAEFIGDTTKIVLMAYYTNLEYDITLQLNPMGGALEQDTKDYYSSNDEIYNTTSSYAKYEVNIKHPDIGPGTSGYNQTYYNYEHPGMTTTQLSVGAQNTYGILLDSGEFLSEDSVSITINELTTNYYISTLVFTNVTLNNEAGNIEKYTIYLVYDHYSNTNQGWSAVVISEKNNTPLNVTYEDVGTAGTTFKIGSNNENANVFTIKKVSNGSGIEIIIRNLYNPGIFDEFGLLTGTQGFTLKCWLETFTVKNEDILIQTPDKENDEVFHQNKGMMTSGQKLTNIEGKEISEGEAAYIWLGTERYLFSSNWGSTIFLSGYYYVRNSSLGGRIQADYRPSYTYDDFIKQSISRNSNLYVYYDRDADMVYYPNQTTLTLSDLKYISSTGLEVSSYNPSIQNTPVGDKEDIFREDMFGAEEEVDFTRWRATFRISGKIFSVILGQTEGYVKDKLVDEYIDNFQNSIYKDCYLKAYARMIGETSRNVEFSTEEAFNDISNCFTKESTSIIVHLTSDGKIEYYSMGDGGTDLYAGFNNTRVVALDPEQSNVYFSSNPGNAVKDSSQYELNYYLSRISLGDLGIEFYKPTRLVSGSNAYYTYDNLMLNPTDTEYCERYVQAINSSIKYFGTEYYIHDAYKVDIKALVSTSESLGVDVFYLYLTRDQYGYTRYFMIFDEFEDEQKASSTNFLNITVEFKKLLNDLTINVTEEDLYLYDEYTDEHTYSQQYVKRSFGIDYLTQDILGFSNSTSYKFNHFDIGQRYSWEDITSDAFKDYLEYRTFYEVGGLTNLHDINNLGDTPTLYWSSLTKFYPADTNRFRIYATDGYVIKSLRLSLQVDELEPTNPNHKIIISFELDESSFDNLIASNFGKFQYLDVENLLPKIKYKIDGITSDKDYHANNQNIGFNILDEVVSSKTGIAYSIQETQEWTFSSSESYTIDQIFMLLSGIYSNVEIDITTTSYSEYLIQSGEEDENPLMKEGFGYKEVGFEKPYVLLDSGDSKNPLAETTILTLATQKWNYVNQKWVYDFESAGCDPHPGAPTDGFSTGAMTGVTSLSKDDLNYIGDKYLALYYMSDDSTSGIKQGTIRIIFCGTVSRIKGGLHFIATNNNQSVYFTNALYYGETVIEVNKKNLDAFNNLDDFSGRTNDDETITAAETLTLEANAIEEEIDHWNNVKYVVLDGQKYYIYKGRALGEIPPFEWSSSPYYNSYICLELNKDSDLGHWYNDEIAEASYNQAIYKAADASVWVKYYPSENRVEYKVPVDGDLQFDGKMVYLSTGQLGMSRNTDDVDVPFITGYFVNSERDINFAVKSGESNNKYLMSMVAYKNTIEVTTDSYLFDKTAPSGTYTEGSVQAFGRNELQYSYNFFVDDETGEKKVAFEGENVYQLDNTKKVDSWFNDTILTNMQFNSYKDFNGDGTPNPAKTWINRSLADENVSEISTQIMEGFDFSWTYYSIAGYFLRYIMVYLVDLEKYYIIDVESILESSNQVFIPITLSGAKEYDYNFKLEFDSDIDSDTSTITEGTRYRFYPTIFEGDDVTGNVFATSNDEINKIKSVSLMANDIKVAFISEPYSYTIRYVHHDNTGSFTNLTGNFVGVSTTPTFTGGYQNAGATYQDVIYDCMTMLTCNLQMTGYTFIGWGSGGYYNGSGYTDRYTPSNGTLPSVWNTQSSWFDPTIYFTKAGVSAYENAVNYGNYMNDSKDYPTTAFYVKNGYFVTDTGYVGGDRPQNYNFFDNYKEQFNNHIENGLNANDANPASDIYLYGLFKVNVYTISFEVNNPQGDPYYLQLDDSDWFTTNFTEDKFGINRQYGTGLDTYTKTYYAYIAFDTNAWYYSENNNQSLMYSYRYTEADGPYTISDVTDESNLSRLKVDMFGYSWLGWYYKKYGVRSEVVNVSLSGLPEHVFNSSYNKVGGDSLPKLEHKSDGTGFYDILKAGNAIHELDELSQEFKYRGQHKTPNAMVYTRKVLTLSSTASHNNFALSSGNKKISFKFQDKDYYCEADDLFVKNETYYVYSKETNEKVENLTCQIISENYPGMPFQIALTNSVLVDGSNLNSIQGYIYHYNYASNGFGNIKNNYANYGGVLDFVYNVAHDALNTFHWQDSQLVYSRKSSENLVFSYFDTSLSAECYAFSGSGSEFYLDIIRIPSNVRYIKLYANWVENTYRGIIDLVDDDASFQETGSSTASYESSSAFDKVNGGSTYRFNVNSLDYDLKQINPYRVGYDFVGWSFSYINPHGNYSALVEIINQPSPVLRLCTELFTYYAALNNVGFAEGVKDYESNIFLTVNDRLFDAGGNSRVSDDWLLNQPGLGETLGDMEGTNADMPLRYFYVFPVWKVQTFSINVSLDIDSNDLKNLYEKDSNFAVGLYEGSAHADYDANDSKTIAYTGVSSKFYTYDKAGDGILESNANDNYSYYSYYFNDIIANICFEIQFDQAFETAKLSFAGKTYSLKDLFVTSAGYYFLGLLYNKISSDNYLVRNTLKSVLMLDSDNYSKILHEQEAEKSIYYGKEVEDDDVDIFNVDMYQNLVVANFAESSIISGSKWLYEVDNQNINNVSTNFGTVTRSTKKYAIKSELVGTNYYLYVLIDNVKYYVVFYQKQGTNPVVDNFTFDKTFLYYNVKDTNGIILNTYIVRFSADGKMYYVDDSFKQAKFIDNTKIILYKSARNTYWNNAPADVSLDYTSFVAETTRQFMLYADWEQKSILAEVNNGNNNNDNTFGATDDNNPGLGGWYSIAEKDSESAIASETVSTSTGSSVRIYQDVDFYDSLFIELLPYYNGRYLSEITLEFDSFVESNSGVTSSFAMVHNILVLRLNFDNAIHRLYVNEVYWNGSNASATLSNVYSDAYAKYYARLANIDTLSFVDKYTMNNTSTNKQPIQQFAYNFGTKHGRTDINPVTWALVNVMTDVKFTCKFSVQTYKVEIYNIVTEHSLIEDTDGYDTVYRTNFSTVDQMESSSNKNVNHRDAYGLPYISSLNFNLNNRASTISTNSAIKKQSYNVPYHHYLGEAKDLHSSQNEYGLTYIYGTGYTYYNGTTETNVTKGSDVLDKIYDAADALGYMYHDENKIWFTYHDTNSGVRLKLYDDNNYIGSDIVIYGYLKPRVTSGVKVQFYYWDSEYVDPTTNLRCGKYMPYINNEIEYSTDVAQGGKINGNKITELPSASIAPWLEDPSRKFVGYVCFNEKVLNQVTSKKDINRSYASLKMEAKTTYTETDNDLISALYKKGLVELDDISDTYYGYQLIDLFKYQIRVADNRYYTESKKVNDNKVETTILQGIKAAITFDNVFGADINGDGVDDETFTITKDLKMLNVDTELETGTTYAIPIYEEINFDVAACNYASGRLSLTTNTNMIHSNVFETNSLYTIFHRVMDARIAISNLKLTANTGESLMTLTSYKGTVNLSKLVDVSSSSIGKYYSYSEVERGYGENAYSYGLKQMKFTGSTKYYVYLYYVDRAFQAFYMTEAIEVDGTKVYNSIPTNAVIDAYISPLEVQLEGDYQEYYDDAEATILDSDISFGTDEVDARMTLMYITMQLLQLSQKEENPEILFEDNKNAYNYSDGYITLPTQSGGGYYNISSIIDMLNDNNNPELDCNYQIYTNVHGFYRMAYSLTYYFYLDSRGKEIADGLGIGTLYGDGGGTILNYTDCNGINQGSGSLGLKKLHDVVAPGDLLKDDRTGAEPILVKDLTESANYRYSYRTIQFTSVAMYLSTALDSEDVSTIYMIAQKMDENGNLTHEIDIITTPESRFDRSLYQNADNYRSFKMPALTSLAAGIVDDPDDLWIQSRIFDDDLYKMFNFGSTSYDFDGESDYYGTGKLIEVHYVRVNSNGTHTVRESKTYVSAKYVSTTHAALGGTYYYELEAYKAAIPKIYEDLDVAAKQYAYDSLVPAAYETAKVAVINSLDQPQYSELNAYVDQKIVEYFKDDMGLMTGGSELIAGADFSTAESIKAWCEKYKDAWWMNWDKKRDYYECRELAIQDLKNTQMFKTAAEALVPGIINNGHGGYYDADYKTYYDEYTANNNQGFITDGLNKIEGMKLQAFTGYSDATKEYTHSSGYILDNDYCVKFDYLDPDKEQWFYYVRYSTDPAYGNGLFASPMGSRNDPDGGASSKLVVDGKTIMDGYDSNNSWIRVGYITDEYHVKSERIYTRYKNLFNRS